MRLGCGHCGARSPSFKETDLEFTWQCGACMKKNHYIPPKKPKKKEVIKTQDVELETLLTDINIGEENVVGVL